MGYLPLHPMPPPSPGPVKDKNEGLHAQELSKISRRQQQKIKPSVRSSGADEGRRGSVQWCRSHAHEAGPASTPSAKQEGYLVI